MGALVERTPNNALGRGYGQGTETFSEFLNCNIAFSLDLRASARQLSLYYSVGTLALLLFVLIDALLGLFKLSLALAASLSYLALERSLLF
jgi:hypothetical protein